jgi:hypothetical protein
MGWVCKPQRTPLYNLIMTLPKESSMPGSKAGDQFQSLFEYAPISLWEEDYSDIKLFFDTRDPGFRCYLDEHPEELRTASIA